jgi:hypothetical protein
MLVKPMVNTRTNMALWNDGNQNLRLVLIFVLGIFFVVSQLFKKKEPHSVSATIRRKGDVAQ